MRMDLIVYPRTIIEKFTFVHKSTYTPRGQTKFDLKSLIRPRNVAMVFLECMFLFFVLFYPIVI